MITAMKMAVMAMAATTIAAIGHGGNTDGGDDDGGDVDGGDADGGDGDGGDSIFKKLRRARSREGVVSVDRLDDVPQAYAQVGRRARRRRPGNRHRRARGRIVAPVEEVRRRYRDGGVHGGGPRAGLRYNGRDAEKPEDAADGWRETAHNRPAERRRSAADGVGADHSCGKASEKQRERRKPPRCSMASVHFQEESCSKLRDACKKLSVVIKYLTKGSVSYFDLADNPRHERVFSRKDAGPHCSIRLTISAWKMYSSTSALQNAPIRCQVTPELTR